MADKLLQDKIRAFNAKEKALKAMGKIPQHLWTDEDSITCQNLRMQMYKLLSEIHKMTEK